MAGAPPRLFDVQEIYDAWFIESCNLKRALGSRRTVESVFTAIEVDGNVELASEEDYEDFDI